MIRSSPCSSLYFRHFDLISEIEIPEVSSMIILELPIVPAPSISFSQSVSVRLPVLNTWASTWDSREKRRFTSCSLDISRLKIATARFWRNATCWAILSTNAVFPMEGRAAISTRSERWSPDSL